MGSSSGIGRRGDERQAHIRKEKDKGYERKESMGQLLFHRDLQSRGRGGQTYAKEMSKDRVLVSERQVEVPNVLACVASHIVSSREHLEGEA